jgi:hypothetical protein
VAEHLPSLLEALSLIPSSDQKNKGVGDDADIWENAV